MKKQQSGFTLIELMIVVAIIGILASIALPAYQNFIARSQASESVVLLDAARTTAEDYVVSEGTFIADRSTLSSYDVRLAGTYGSVTGVNGALSTGAGSLVYKTSATGVNNKIKSKTVQITRDADGAWTCTTDLTAKFAPKGCTPGQTALAGS